MKKVFTKNFLLNSIGIFLIVLGLIRIFQLIFLGDPIHIFWFCNHIIVFIGIAILFRSAFWLKAEFALLFFGQLCWMVSFLLYWIFGVVSPGSSTHLVDISSFIGIISILVHFLTLPLGVWAIFLLNKKSKFEWVGSLIHFAVLIPFILYFGSKYNLNCFLRPCFDFLGKIPLYPLFIFLAYFFLTIIPTIYLLNYLIKKRNK